MATLPLVMVTPPTEVTPEGSAVSCDHVKANVTSDDFAVAKHVPLSWVMVLATVQKADARGIDE